MVKILALLSGSAGPWVLIGAAVACLAAGGTGGYIARGVIDAPALSRSQKETADAKAQTAQCIASHEKARADGAEQALTALGQSVVNVTSALETLAAKAAARGKSLDQFLKEIANAPPSKVCGGSAAELAYRRSVAVGVQQPAVPAAP